MTTTQSRRKPPGLNRILQLVREKYLRHEINWRYHPDALTLEEMSQRSKARQAEIATTKEEIKQIGRADLRLIEAARFALDVDGDEPSWTQLQEAFKAAERRAYLVERLHEIEASRNPFTPRCEILIRVKGDIGWRSIVGDTWDDVWSRIEGNQ